MNDEINKLLREKRHWENQLVALGGANYRRNVAMLDDDGREVPGTKGYKCVADVFRTYPSTDTRARYFGRAKDLPGVKELFQSRKVEEEEEGRVYTFYKKFLNQGPAYFGDLDEQNAEENLAEFERSAEEDGWSYFQTQIVPLTDSNSEWQEAYTNLREALGLPEDDPVPPMPRQPTETKPNTAASEQEMAAARAAASFIPFLSPEALLPPAMPTKAEMDAVMLNLYKQKLSQEVLG